VRTLARRFQKPSNTKEIGIRMQARIQRWWVTCSCPLARPRDRVAPYNKRRSLGGRCDQIHSKVHRVRERLAGIDAEQCGRRHDRRRDCQRGRTRRAADMLLQLAPVLLRHVPVGRREVCQVRRCCNVTDASNLTVEVGLKCGTFVVMRGGALEGRNSVGMGICEYMVAAPEAAWPVVPEPACVMRTGIIR
jgi:hypothetical protein